LNAGADRRAAEIAAQAADRRFISVEFIYKARPSGSDYDSRRRRAVFDYALRSRLTELARRSDAALILCCADSAAAASLAPILAEFPALTALTAVVNPEAHAPPFPDAETPRRCEWDAPEAWTQFQTTDRWARIAFALEVGQHVAAAGGEGWIVMPAHDAVWGAFLLDDLAVISLEHQRGGQPAAVSPYSDRHHSAVPGVWIDPRAIRAVNWAFHRRHDEIASGACQQFWGKMGIIPYGMCGAIRQRVEMRVWEDDLEIDSAVRSLGYAAVTALAARRRVRYRQALPAFSLADVLTIFERTLHYSLPIPGNTSLLARPFGELWKHLPDYALNRWYLAACIEALVAICRRRIAARLQRYGCSWVDWGAYRHVVRVGDPFVQVWKDRRKSL
jgi:hypothetical protein